MIRTGYIIFEIGRECNLGHIHTKCPNSHPDRYRHVDTKHPMSDDTIVDTAVALIQEHGFRGLVAFHYYNEPSLSANRMFALMDRITDREPSARFVLWTNGTLIANYDRRYGAFHEIHVTDYELESHPCQSHRLYGIKDSVHVHRWQLDDRLNTTGSEPGRPESDKPCCRMFTEMIFDYYGNVHLCCYDWRGLADAGNIHTSSLGVLVASWQGARRWMIGEKMEPFVMPGRNGAAPVCRTCTAPGRSTHITEFVKAPSDAAKAYRQEVLRVAALEERLAPCTTIQAKRGPLDD